MENNSLGNEYGDYSDLPDLPVDCADGSCMSIDLLHATPLLLYAAVFLVGVPGNAMMAWVTWKEARQRAQLRQSLPAACRWALKEPQSEDESMVSKKSTSHDLVSEMEV